MAGLPVFNIAAAVLVLGAVTPGLAIVTVLSSRLLVRVGVISYSLYVWHQLARWLTGWHDPWDALALSVLLALLSYRYIERPFRRRWRPGLEPAWQSVQQQPALTPET